MIENKKKNMAQSYNFIWDTAKAKTNTIKHKISFETATGVFKDKHAISIFDEEHSEDEERWITIGMDMETRVLVVVHTFIEMNSENVTIRIISARKATKAEQKTYNGE